MRLFGRKAFVIVNDVKVTGLDLSFKVEKSLGKHPNTCEVDLFNLSRETVARMRIERAPVVVVAGYEEGAGQLFAGDARSITPVRQAPGWVLQVRCGDGEKAYQLGHVAESFPPGTSVKDVVGKVAKQIGVGLGNAVKQLSKGGLKLDEFTNGLTAMGPGVHTLDNVARAAGFSWSIQDGELQLLTDGETSGEAVELTPDTGLVGSPEMINPEKKGEPSRMRAKSLLQPRLRPGGIVEVSSEGFARRQFRIEKVTHEGDKAGQAWYSTLEAKVL